MPAGTSRIVRRRHRAAVEAFQTGRGLRIDGICGEQTWAALVEAGYRLGDRRLYQRKPMMRATTSPICSADWAPWGFDAGKVDGIYGPETAGALAEFQRNAGLTVDGIFGPDELQVLERLGDRGDGLVAELRELASLRWSARTLERLRWSSASGAGSTPARAVTGHTLGRHGAVLHHPDGIRAGPAGERGRRPGLHPARGPVGGRGDAAAPTTRGTRRPRRRGGHWPNGWSSGCRRPSVSRRLACAAWLSRCCGRRGCPPSCARPGRPPRWSGVGRRWWRPWSTGWRRGPTPASPDRASQRTSRAPIRHKSPETVVSPKGDGVRGLSAAARAAASWAWMPTADQTSCLNSFTSPLSDAPPELLDHRSRARRSRSPDSALAAQHGDMAEVGEN